MLNGCMSWIDTSQIPAGERMGEVASRINSELARFCELLVEADRTQEWLADGSPTPQQWLTARFGLDPAYGRRLFRIARRLEELPELRKRFAAGELSLDAVDVLSEVATSETELDLLEEADGKDIHDLARLASRRKPPTREESAASRDAEWISTQWDLHRRKMRLAGELAGMDAQIVEDRLVEKARTMPKNPETGEYDDWSKRMANALVETCATDPEGTASVPTLVVHTDVSVLGGPAGDGVSEISTGPVISNELARMLGCDSALEMAIERDGRPIGVGHKTRSIPAWLRRQVEHRDHHCRFPGCGRTAFLQVHHRLDWALGGATDLDNLVLLCWWHHIFMHDKGWHITRDVDGHFVFRKPDWSPYPPRPT
jgi:hypothetical protein